MAAWTFCHACPRRAEGKDNPNLAAMAILIREALCTCQDEVSDL